MLRLLLIAASTVLLPSLCSAQYYQQYSGGCNGGQATGQSYTGPGMLDDVQLARFREVHRYRGSLPPYFGGYSQPSFSGYGYPSPSYSVPGVYGYTQPSYQYGYGQQFSLQPQQYGYQQFGYAQPYMQCGPNGCSIGYR